MISVGVLICVLLILKPKARLNAKRRNGHTEIVNSELFGLVQRTAGQ